GRSGSTSTQGQALPLISDDEVDVSRLYQPVDFTQSIAHIAEIVTTNRNQGDDSIDIGVPGGVHLVALLNFKIREDDRKKFGPIIDEHGATRIIDRIYWRSNTSAFVAILDNVKTTIVELVSEVRLGTKEDPEVT